MKKFVVIFILFLIIPIANVRAGAETLGQLKQELQNLKNQKAANDASKKKTQSDISNENAKIANANAEVEQANTDIKLAENKINESNDNIKKMKEETEKLIVFYEVMLADENSFLEYISGAETMTDLTLRSEAVSQILSYNEDELTKLEQLIHENEQLQVDLKQKQKDLEKKINVYQSTLKSLNNDLSSLLEVSLDISDQITAQQKLIKYYEEIGCKDDEPLSKCVEVASSGKWLKPTDRGYISSGFGYRSFYLNGKPYSDFHPAVDVAGNSGGTPVYAAAAGTVAAVIRKASCGGNQVYIHVRVLGVAYTLTYAHLKDVYVNVGDKVDQTKVIGTVGGGGATLKSNGGWDTCSTGWHLHFGVANGFYLGGGSEGYSSYSKYVANSITPPMMPAYGKWYYSRY